MASGFVWGVSENNLSNDVQLGGYATGVTSGTLVHELDGLSASSTYYYKAYVQVWDSATSTAVPVYGELKSFTTPAPSENIPTGWLELPASTSGDDYYEGSFFAANGNGVTERNYSYLYQKSRYTSLWVAYPLTSDHIEGSASGKTWKYNSNISNDLQIDVKENSYGTNYNNDTYSRGHQIPAADRKCSENMRGQTYYLTNQTPQNQDGFNSPMWSNLEAAVRDLTSSADTVYVVTGAAFQTNSQTETIQTLTGVSGITPHTIYIPNYYWKVLLKVKWEGSGASKHITSASAIGVWMYHHTNYHEDQTAWTEHICSVNQIEQYTGFDFFVNLPGDNNSGFEASAEANTSWSTFVNF